jgi:hypothetical protein
MMSYGAKQTKTKFTSWKTYTAFGSCIFSAWNYVRLRGRKVWGVETLRPQ